MIARTIIAAIAFVTAVAGHEPESINLGQLCDHLSPGTSITIRGHRVTRSEDGGCTIENTNSPAPSLKTGEERT